MDKLEERLRTRRRFIYVGDLKYVQNFEPDADCHEAADEITRLTEALRQVGMIFERADESDGEKVRKAYRLVCQTLVARSSGKAGSDA